MKRKLALGVCLLAAVAAPALAILGLGDIVFDPTSFGELVKQFEQMEQEYTQLVQTYQMVQNQYSQMLFMAKQVPVNMIARYRALATPWIMSNAANVYGTTSGWTSGINTGSGVPGGYATATLPLTTYGAGFANIPADQVDRIKTGYATVELADGANIAGMQILGNLRAHAPAVEAAIQNLEDDTLSSDPNMNSEVALLDKIGAANVVNLRNGQDTNKLLGTLAEEQIIAAKRQRDAETQAFNEHIAFVNQEQAVLAAQTSGASAALLAWRMP